MGPVSPHAPLWDLHVYLSANGHTGRPCRKIDEHAEIVARLTAGCTPDSPRDVVVRSLPDPQAWVAMGGGFYRSFPCGCSLHMVPA